jgi:N-acetylglucosamine kinase-like BadF-type ATPase
MSFYLGIDGGGTKTRCVVGDETVVLATGTGSGSNVVRLGEGAARAGLEEAIGHACSRAGVDPQQIQSVCLGAAGSSHGAVNAALKKMLREMLPLAEATIVGDMEIAHEAALSRRPGVITIAGTGSIAYGRNEAGETARAGGWGFQISDEGSGHWVGRQAVIEIMKAFDCGRSTVLLDRVLHEWKGADRDELVRMANATPSPNFASLFPLVQQAAEEHDAVASNILSAAGRELGQLALTVMRRLWPEDATVRVGVGGGVFANSRQVRRAFYESTRAGWSSASICFKVADPVLGALQMARQRVIAGAAR